MPKQRIVVFFLSQFTEGSYTFSPNRCFGFVTKKKGEANGQAAERFVQEKQNFANDGIRQDMRYTFTLLAYSAPTTVAAAESEDGQQFLRYFNLA